MTAERICVLYTDAPGVVDAIRAYSLSLVAALNEEPGVEAELALYGRDGAWRAVAGRSTAVVLQYNPFSYGRWGFAPALVADLWLGRDLGLSVMVHETYVTVVDWRSALMSAWQRIQLRGVLVRAGAIWLAAERFRSHLPRHLRLRATHLPIGSNLPDARSRRAEFRARAGAGEGRLVVVAIGSSHPSRPLGHVAAAITALDAAGTRPLVLNLGAEAPRLSDLPPGVDVLHPGALPAGELAGWVAAADLALLPFVDGVSTRRSTVVAALQHGVCVLSTDGRMTDDELRETAALVLTAADDAAAFACAAARLGADPRLRARHATAGRLRFERRHAWPVVARGLLEALRHRQ